MKKIVNKKAQKNSTSPLFNFSIKYKKIQTMKNLLNLKEDFLEATEENLQNMLIEHSNKNILRLAGICFYLTNFPKNVKTIIKKALKRKTYDNDFSGYQNLYKNEPDFLDYSLYVTVHIFQEALTNFNQDNVDDEELIQAVYHEYRQTYMVLLYNLLPDEIKENENFNFDDFINNLPFLFLWIDKNKQKKISPLTNEECKILSALLFGLEKDEMISYIPALKDWESLQSKMAKITKKFHVENITQAIFRIILLKPYIWARLTCDEIYFEIKEIRKLVQV